MIKVQDIVHVIIGAPDLDRHEAFLGDFGMVRVARTDDRLYMRGVGKYPYIHVSVVGDPGLISCALLAGSAAELDDAAALPGASAVEDIDAPGGGRRVRMKGPDGFRIDLVHGIAEIDEKPMREPLSINFARRKHRIDSLQRHQLSRFPLN